MDLLMLQFRLTHCKRSLLVNTLGAHEKCRVCVLVIVVRIRAPKKACEGSCEHRAPQYVFVMLCLSRDHFV